MSIEKFKHYAIKTSENFLAKDSRTNCLEIYEDELSAVKVVNRSKQDISIVPCYVYTEKEHGLFADLYDLLDRMLDDDCNQMYRNEGDKLMVKVRGVHE